MEPLACLVVDDEPLARKGLKEYITDTPFLRLAGEVDSALKVMPFLHEGGIQAIFLDIQMPRLTGLQLLKTMPQSPPVVFTTAYPQYAVDGFELNALDYLVKPVSFERFLKAAQRIREYYEIRKANEIDLPSQEKEGYFFIKADNKLVKLVYADILFAEALQNYVAIYTTTKKYITYLTFKSIEDYLPPTAFLKTHKSYLVALSKIDNIEGNIIHIGEYQIPISRTSKDEVLERLLNGRFLKR